MMCERESRYRSTKSGFAAGSRAGKSGLIQVHHNRRPSKLRIRRINDTMFAQSYHPLGHGQLLPPGSFEKRKKKEHAHRRRAVEMEHRRRSVLLEEEGFRREDQRRRGEMLIEDVGRLRRCPLDSLTRIDAVSSTDSTSSSPPPFIYARVSASHDETDQDLETALGNLNRMSSCADEDMLRLKRLAIMHAKNQHTDSKMSVEDDDDDSFVPPHIIGEEDVSDYDDDQE